MADNRRQQNAWRQTWGRAPPTDRTRAAAAVGADEAGYMAIQVNRRQTQDYDLTDSPVELAARIVEKRWGWTTPPMLGRSRNQH